MCGLIISWRRLQARQDPEVNLVTSKYGSDNVERALNVHRISIEDINSLKAKDMNDLPDLESNYDPGTFRKKDLSPLVIHKQMSGENIEDTGVVHVEQDENNQLDVANDYVEKSPLQDYLKLVTMTPLDDEVKSLETPMSPRELFFIDLIREAEKAESAKSSKEKRHFFPDEMCESDTKNVKDIENKENIGKVKNLEDGKDIKDMKNVEENMKNEIHESDTKNVKDIENEENVAQVKNFKDEKDMKNMKNVEENTKDNEKKTKEENSKHGSSYFIADVDNAVSEKTEVFLQIDSGVGEQIELTMEESVLTLQTDEENLQKIISETGSITRDD